MSSDQLRLLPSIEKFSHALQTEPPFAEIGPAYLSAIAREAVASLRAKILADPVVRYSTKADVESILREDVAWRLHLRLGQVINGTGIALHTNLGRSLLATAAQEAVAAVSGRYANLEYNLQTGERGSRHTQIAAILQRLLGVEAAMVVNNNAAATFLALNTLCAGREVIISRGQLVEIGGSFRMPDVMACSGAIMREVGTTNKTHLSDYEQAINERTAAIIDVHTSNYRIHGFTRAVPLSGLAALAERHHLHLISDLGSGALIDLSQYGLEKEPMVQESLAAGADVVMFSGDKLLGGPQAGLILAKANLIGRLKKNPFTRMFRCDKMTLAALEATLELYFDCDRALAEIPTLRMITRLPEDLHRSASQFLQQWRAMAGSGYEFQLISGFSEVGGGALPTVQMPTTLVSIQPQNITVDQLEARLRRFRPPIIGRIQKEAFLLDPRTLLAEDGEWVGRALAVCVESK